MATITKKYVEGRKAPYQVLWRENGKRYSRFFESDETREAFIQAHNFLEADEFESLLRMSKVTLPESVEFWKISAKTLEIHSLKAFPVRSLRTGLTAFHTVQAQSAITRLLYKYDNAGRLLEEHLDGKLDVSYKYGYLDKVIEINRNGAVTKFNYDGMGMLVEKILPDGKSEKWVWDGMALVARGGDIYVNEAHIAGGTPILTKTDKGIRYHASDFLGTTLWSSDMKGNIVDDYADTSVFGEGSIQHDRSARFTGKPYDEDLQAFVFPFRNDKPDLARWTSSDPAGFPDGINNHFYACVPTMSIDPWGLYGINFTTNPTNTNSSSYTADKAVYDGGNKLVGSKDDSAWHLAFSPV